MTSELTLGASARARLLLVVAATGLLTSVIYGSPALAVFAFIALLPLLSRPDSNGPDHLRVECQIPRGQLVEGDPIETTVTITLAERASVIDVELVGNSWVHVPTTRWNAQHTAQVVVSAPLVARRWGTAVAPTLRVTAVSRDGLRTARAELPLPAEIVALPRPATVAPIAAAAIRRGRTGNHPSGMPGSGVEFHGIRPYQPGDLPRQIHWPTSSRRGSLYITERAAEAAMDVVVVIDALCEAGALGRSTLDDSVRGAAGVARTLLDNADRVGLAVLGGVLGWLPPATSSTQWYRIVTTALGVAVHESYLTPDLARIPRVALPPGALVVVFSSLLDERAMTVVNDLRRRRFDVLVVDVLRPPGLPRRPNRIDLLADRLWRLQRDGVHARLSAAGCTVIRWDSRRVLQLPAVTPRGSHRGVTHVVRTTA